MSPPWKKGIFGWVQETKKGWIQGVVSSMGQRLAPQEQHMVCMLAPVSVSGQYFNLGGGGGDGIDKDIVDSST